MEFALLILAVIGGVVAGAMVAFDSKEEQQAKADRGWIELNGKVYRVIPADVVARQEG